MIAPKIVVFAVVLRDQGGAASVVFEHDPVSVGGALIILVLVVVVRFHALVGRHELDLGLNVVWK